MRLPEPVRLRLLNVAQRVMEREPDVKIQKNGSVYVERWHATPRSRLGGLYIHRFHRDDADGALHDHRYANLSVILKNDYTEELFMPWPTPRFDHAGQRITRRLRRREGEIVFRLPWTAHRVELNKPSGFPGFGLGPVAVTTMFVTGPHVRNWGFHCPKGWVPWEVFVGSSDVNYSKEQAGGCP